MPKVSIPQLNKVLEVSPSETLMHQLLKYGLPVASSCDGDGICGKCRMEFQSKAPLPPPSDLEKETLKKSQAEPNERLCCQFFCVTDLVVKTTYW